MSSWVKGCGSAGGSAAVGGGDIQREEVVGGRRPVYRWKRLGAGYKASAAGAASGGGGPLDSGMAAFFSQIGSRKADLPNRVNHFL